MAQVLTTSVVRQLGTLFAGGSVAGLTDRQLVERFINRRDAGGEAAFAALVTRHGPMVLGVCRQLLGDHQRAEDAFQAVFLVLARRARSVREPDLLGNWLYGVALRTARKAKIRLDRRRKYEEDHAVRHPEAGSTVPADQSAIDRERAEALHEEIDRLPSSFRLPVVLCYFEGLSLDEAARRLRCPAGTVHSRLVRAREKLRRGLTRRGVVLPAAALTAALAPRSASASISSPLCDITTRAALNFAAGQAASPLAMALAQEVLRSMLIHKLRFTIFTLLALAAFATGAGYLTHSLAMKDEPVKNPAGQAPPLAARSEPHHEDQPRPTTRPDPAAPGRMTVAGRVLDPSGKPVRGAPVDVIGRPRAPWVGTDDSMDRHLLLGRGSTGHDGRFRLDASRTSSVRFFEVYALTTAPGYGLGWAALNPDADQPAADIRLQPDQPIQGRLVAISGQPAAAVEIRVAYVRHRYISGPIDGLSFWDDPPEGLRTWPGPVKTDDQGRFTLAGIGRGFEVFLGVQDLRFARLSLHLPADDREGPREVTLALQPATIIEGRAVAADTGQPIPDAVIAVAAGRGEFGAMFTMKFRADDRGRFTANPSPGDYFRVSAFAPEGRPYLVPQVEFAWTKGAVKKVMDIKLPRGILIRGKVIEEGTGHPLTGASLQYYPMNRRDDILGGWQAIVASKADGSYQIVVPPGKGHLLVFGPTSDYVLEEIGSRMLTRGQPGGQRYYAHDIIAYEVKAGDQPHELTAALRPGKTVRGRVVGPAGQTVEAAAIITRLHIEAFHPSWRGDFQLHARDGLFELHGLDPERPAPVYFLDADHEWGAAVELSGKQADEELMIRLQPCGRARARFVGPDGKPCAETDLRQLALLQILATPGPDSRTFNKAEQAQLAADEASNASLDRKHYRNGLRADPEGRITLPDLIPGALYRICDLSVRNDADKGIQVRRDFTVKPGETLDLGDIRIERPQP